MKMPYLEAGKFCATHGIKGDVKAECWCDDLSVLEGLDTLYIKKGEEYRALHVLRCVPFKNLALIRIEGYDNPEEAAVLKNRIFYAKREDLPLPKGSCFIADLIGLKVYDEDDGRLYGTIDDVLESAASQLYAVKTPEEKIAYLPAVPQFIVRIDPEEGVFVRPVKGLFDEI